MFSENKHLSNENNNLYLSNVCQLLSNDTSISVVAAPINAKQGLTDSEQIPQIGSTAEEYYHPSNEKEMNQRRKNIINYDVVNILSNSIASNEPIFSSLLCKISSHFKNSVISINQDSAFRHANGLSTNKQLITDNIIQNESAIRKIQYKHTSAISKEINSITDSFSSIAASASTISDDGLDEKNINFISTKIDEEQLKESSMILKPAPRPAIATTNFAKHEKYNSKNLSNDLQTTRNSAFEPIDCILQAQVSGDSSKQKRKKKPYKELTLEEKVELIRLAERNSALSQASIAERYAIAKSNVCRILQRRNEYLRAYESAGFSGSRKRKLRSENFAFNKLQAHDLNVKEVNVDFNAKRSSPTQTNNNDKKYDMQMPVSFGNNNQGEDLLCTHMRARHRTEQSCRCCHNASINTLHLADNAHSDMVVQHQPTLSYTSKLTEEFQVRSQSVDMLRALQIIEQQQNSTPIDIINSTTNNFSSKISTNGLHPANFISPIEQNIGNSSFQSNKNESIEENNNSSLKESLKVAIDPSYLQKCKLFTPILPITTQWDNKAKMHEALLSDGDEKLISITQKLSSPLVNTDENSEETHLMQSEKTAINAILDFSKTTRNFDDRSNSINIICDNSKATTHLNLNSEECENFYNTHKTVIAINGNAESTADKKDNVKKETIISDHNSETASSAFSSISNSPIDLRSRVHDVDLNNNNITQSAALTMTFNSNDALKRCDQLELSNLHLQAEVMHLREYAQKCHNELESLRCISSLLQYRLISCREKVAIVSQLADVSNMTNYGLRLKEIMREILQITSI